MACNILNLMINAWCKMLQSTLRLPGINAGACSGLTLSGAFRPRLATRSLAPSNGSIFFKEAVESGAVNAKDFRCLLLIPSGLLEYF